MTDITIINLDEQFAPCGSGIKYEKTTFPSKFEVNVRLPFIPKSNKVLITTRIFSSNDIFFLLLATDAVKRLGVKDISVFIPYLPYARQDRAMIDAEETQTTEPYQEALSLKVFADILNLQGYSNVFILDPHSDVSGALINNMRKLTNHLFIKKVANDLVRYRIACPDAGAEKKILKLCKAIGYEDEIIMCEKVRDVKLGKLVSVKVHADNLEGNNILIVDDICDGGGTFIMQAQELHKKNCGTISLAVTHGLFTHWSGVKVILEQVNSIYTTDSICSAEYNPFLHISPIEELNYQSQIFKTI